MTENNIVRMLEWDQPAVTFHRKVAKHSGKSFLKYLQDNLINFGNCSLEFPPPPAHRVAVKLKELQDGSGTLSKEQLQLYLKYTPEEVKRAIRKHGQRRKQERQQRREAAAGDLRQGNMRANL